MMSLADVKLLYGLSCMVLCLLAASPVIAAFVSLPGGEPFSEMWLLGEGKLLEGYPFSVGENQSYNVYVGVANHLGRSAYYKVLVKFRNQSETLPNVTIGEPSPLPPLFEYRFFLEPGTSWESPLRFSLREVSVEGNLCQVDWLDVNRRVFAANRTGVWSAEQQGFYYQLFLELWLCDAANGDFSYHNRFVGLWLNVTDTVNS